MRDIPDDFFVNQPIDPSTPWSRHGAAEQIAGHD